MKIAIISRNLWGCIYGGAEKFIHKVAENLARRGHDVTLYTLKTCNPRNIKYSYVIRMLEVKGKSIFRSLGFSIAAATHVSRNNYNVVLVNGYWGELSPVFIKDTPKILVIHDVGFLERSGLHRVTRSLALKAMLRSSDLIVTPSKAVQKMLISHFRVSSTKIRVLGFEGVEGPLQRIHRDNNWFDIVQIARFSPNKGHLLLLYAFYLVASHYKDMRLWLVGGIEPRNKRYFKKVLAYAKIIDSVLGGNKVFVVVNPLNIRYYYELADVCVAASIGEEGYGLSVAECLAYGKPIIASEVFLETGVVTPDIAYIFPRGNAKELARMLEHVYINYIDAVRRAEKGLSYVRKYSWAKVASMIEQLLLEVVLDKKDYER